MDAPNPVYGLKKPRRLPYVAWQMDMDYVSRLGVSERDWLARACDEFYLSAGRREGQLHSDDKLRECWRSYKQNARDALSRNPALELARVAPVDDAEHPEDALLERIDASRHALEFCPVLF